ncbi:MAG TPA: hypothetical protein DCE18_13195, partial [Syntrophobacteraceae bacterium]|nr:hypothetical protein [Syntrophobacteraceae bacterium]
YIAYYTEALRYGYNDTEGTKSSAAYDPSHTYYGLFESNKYYTYTYDATNKGYWEALATPPSPVTVYNFTDKSKDGGPVAAWATATAYALNALVSQGGKSYWCKAAHTSSAASKPETGGSWTTYWSLAGNGTALIEFTATGHNFQVGQLVEFQGLSSHTGMNSNAYKVMAVSGNTFKVAYPWNGNPDLVEGSAQRRVPGTVATGLSGNILNFATASRMDAALRALIYGRGTCDATYCYIRGQGQRRYLRDSANSQAEFYMRPAASDSTVTYPNDYNTGTYNSKTTYVSISGRYSGFVNNLDPNTSPPSSGYYYEPWTFTISQQTQVDLLVYGSWANGNTSFVGIYTDTNLTTLVSGAQLVSGSASTTGNPAKLTAVIDPGGTTKTYYVMVRSNYTGVNGYSSPNTNYTVVSNVNLTKYTGKHAVPANHNGTALTPPGDSDGLPAYPAIGSIPQAQVKIRLNKANRMGVVQKTFNKVRYGFMYYNGDHEGEIKMGCENTDLNAFVSLFDNIYPKAGTPTGSGLEEALDYFTQTDSHSNASNSTYVLGKGSAKDPYYQKDINNVLVPVPCRKSYVLLISDGGWNAGTDPVIPARELHAFDLRTELTPTDPTSDPPNQPYFREVQSVDVFSIFAFGNEECGRRAMKGVAMFGGFADDSSCGSGNWPYGISGYPSSSCEQSGVSCEYTPSGSRCMNWPRPNCNPGGTYDDCCKEWDLNWDANTAGDNLDKGVPDNYFEASEGPQLEAGLLKVLSTAMVRNATASAVATVAQETQDGDVIIRGLFHSSDPETVGRYLWRGHLEAYWPWLDVSKMKLVYDFETDPCFEITGTKHCWDGAEILRNRTPVGTDDRNIYYWDPTATPKTQPFPKFGDIDSTTDPTETANRNLWKTKLGLAATPTADSLVDWVRGTDVATLRDRDLWGLGDIVYSTPIVVGTPSVGAVSTKDPDRDAFYAYRNQQYYRDKVVYVGANDGMVHAFLMAKWDSTKEIWLNRQGVTSSDPNNDNYAADPEIGKELWAYIPSNLLTELQYGANTQYGATGCVHRTMVDLAPQSWEVYIQPPGKTSRSWRTVILGGERGGGDVYFAIDVTDPSTPTVLWEYSMFMNRIIYDRTGNRSLSQCYSNPGGNSGTNCKPANLNTAWMFVDTSASPNAGSPTAATYQSQLKILPIAWSRPSVGRLRIPTTLHVYTGDPTMPGGQSPTAVPEFNFDDRSPWPQNGYHQPRHVAFLGGGVRLFEDDTRAEKDPSLSPAPATDPLAAAYRFDLFRPELLAIDIETGTNLFRYWWPVIQNQTAFQNSTATAFYTLFPAVRAPSSSPTSYVPNALSDPLAIDVQNSDSHIAGDDGYVDTIYVGDLAGNFFGIKLNFDREVTDATSGNPVANTIFGIKVDWWQNKETYIGLPAPAVPAKTNTNNYRGLRQPITVPPIARLDGKDTNFIHVIFGAGKF